MIEATPAGLPGFDQPDLARAVEALTPEQVDALPFGAVRVDADGTVQVYSAGERRLSGSGDRPRLGLPFFATVAPCMSTDGFRGRIERALARGSLDIEFGWTGDFSDRERSMQVRAQSAAAGGFWLFLRRDET